MGDLVIGKNLDGTLFKLPLDLLKKHLIALGNSGSGKTVLCKAIIEEASLNNLPCIIIDPQGDLASLIQPLDKEDARKHKVDVKKIEAYKNKTRVTIFTPTSSKGIPLSINPLKLPESKIDKEELVGILNQISDSICSLIGYKEESARSASSLLYIILMYCYKNKIELNTFNRLIDLIVDVPDSLKKDVETLVPDTHDLIRKLKILTIGEKELLFQFGVPLDIDMLLGKTTRKTQISIIYLNTLNNLKDKQFFVSILVTELYKWMLTNPSKSLQALFYIDEISSYLPSGASKPITKPILKLLFKQARKYGVGCITSTQNPGDIDYSAFAQFSTWCIGRLTTKQDKDKIKNGLESLAGKEINTILTKMSKLRPGEFVVFSPDVFKKIQEMKVRWLLTNHVTLNDVDIKGLVSDELRKEYDSFMVQKIEDDIDSVQKDAKDIKIERYANLHLPLKLSKDYMLESIEKKKMKQFIFVGKATESLDRFLLELYPLFKVKIRRNESAFLGLRKRVGEYDLFFDGIDGELVSFKGGKLKHYKEVKELMGLSETEQLMLIQLINNKKLTSKELGLKLGLSDAFVNKTLHDMIKKKVVTYEKDNKENRGFLWKPLIKVTFSPNPKSLSYIPTLSDEKIDGKAVQTKIDIGLLAKFVRMWFKAEIVEAEVIYIPVYNFTLTSRKGKRSLRISGVNGEELKFYD